MPPKDPAVARAYYRAYYHSHREQKRAYAKSWKARNRDRVNANARKYHAKHRDRKAFLGRERDYRYREEAIVLYGHSCECCGETESAFLTFHHKNNDGAFDRKHNLGQNQHRKFKNPPQRDDIGLLCYNCNCAKHFNGECPHEMAKKTGVLHSS